MNTNRDWRSKTSVIRLKWNVVLTVAAVVAMLSATMVSQTRANRITQELNATSVASVKLAGSTHPMTRRGTDLGMVSGDKTLESMSLNLGLSAAQKAELDTLLAAQQNPNSPQYHKWLTQEQFGARFGATTADIEKMKSWLTTKGFVVKSVAPSRNQITFTGTVAQAEAAFRTQIHQYNVNGQMHIANSTDVSLPQALAGVVSHVGGLNSFRPKPRAVFTKPNPEFTSKTSGNHFLSPGDWATIYNVNSVYTSATGSGMHVGIVGQTYIPKTDIDNFRSAAGLPATKLTYVCISSSNCTNAAGESIYGDMGEADLDVEWAGGIAKDATVDYIYASAADTTQGVYEALSYAITTYKVGGAVVPVISMSYGNCETDLLGYTAYRTQMDSFFAQAASQGQTILNSSGDAGAAGCDQGFTIATTGAVADWPASSPNIMGIGGTRFSADEGQTYSGTYWSGSNSADTISSALQYIPETVWNDTAADQVIDSTSTLSSGGGGVSQFYSLPTWQQDYTGAGKRYVPDVSFAASADHDGYLVCTQVLPAGATSASQSLGSSCVTGFRYSNNGLSVFGGTSAGSPAFAGVVTLLVQKYGNLGNLNSKLYSVAGNAASYAKAFHDVTTGDNKQPCTTGSPNCTGGLVGYSAGTGFDLATGLGSVNAGGLASIMAPPSFSMTQATTTYTISSASSTTVPLTITSTNYSGTVTFATVVSPAGTVTATATPVTLSGDGDVQTSTLTITTSATAKAAPVTKPWKSGGAVLFCSVLLGLPLMRRKRALAVLLTSAVIAMAGFTMACGGGGSGSGSKTTVTARTYTVTVTPTGSGTVTNASPMTFTITVP